MRLFSGFFVSLTALTCLSLSVPPAARAQFAVYGMGSGGFLGSNTANGSGSNGFSAYGYTLGAYDDFLRLGPLKLGGDARYFQQTSSGNGGYGNKLRGGMVGPRLALKLPLFPLKPYVQGEVGGVSTNYGVLPSSTGKFAYMAQVGADFTIFPHLDLRGEYGGGQIGGLNGEKTRLQEVGIGLVVRFF